MDGRPRGKLQYLGCASGLKLPTHWALLAIPDLDATLANGIVIMPRRDNRIAAL
jgi:hypothetical protein